MQCHSHYLPFLLPVSNPHFSLCYAYLISSLNLICILVSNYALCDLHKQTSLLPSCFNIFNFYLILFIFCSDWSDECIKVYLLDSDLFDFTCWISSGLIGTFVCFYSSDSALIFHFLITKAWLVSAA